MKRDTLKAAFAARFLLLALVAAPFSFAAEAQPAGHNHSDHAMHIDRDGMVMNSNRENLPEDCPAVSKDIDIEVRVGRRFSRTGLTFGYNVHEWKIPPCARVSVRFFNDDEIRHQWMVHGLPKYLYPQGMFHLEVNGGKQIAGTFIVPSDHATYLVHCDLSHHMEQGLKGQLVVGEGNGNLPSIPGVSGARFPDVYP
jgi:hypothetical protein